MKKHNLKYNDIDKEIDKIVDYKEPKIYLHILIKLVIVLTLSILGAIGIREIIL